MKKKFRLNHNCVKCKKAIYIGDCVLTKCGVYHINCLLQNEREGFANELIQEFKKNPSVVMNWESIIKELSSIGGKA